MKVKPHLRKLAKKAPIYKERFTVPKNFSGLNCRGGTGHFEAPQTVVEFIEEYDWATGIWRGDLSALGNLRQQICKFWSDYAELKLEQIKFGYGSMQVLERINRAFLEPGTKVLGYAPQFDGYMFDLTMCGADYKTVLLDPERNFRFDAGRLLSEISSDYCLIYVDNPNNPTGQLINLSDIEEIVKEASKKDVVVIVDEAYADYAEKTNSAVNLINKYQNVIVTRTFTKGYQFTGIRVGYGIFTPELSGYYDKAALPLGIPAAGSYIAKEALLDKEFIPNLRQRVKSIKDKLVRGLKERGYLISDTLDTCPIFILGHKDKDCDLKNDLLSRGISALPGTGYINLGKNYVRVTIPAKAEDFLDRVSK